MTTINTTDDLLSLLRDNQEFREAVRQAILSESCSRSRQYSMRSRPRYAMKSKSLKMASSDLNRVISDLNRASKVIQTT